VDVSVKTYANLRSVIGKEVLTLRLKGTPTVGEALHRLVEQYGEQIRKYISGDRIVFLINGRNIRSMNGLDTRLGEGDLITVLPVLSGG
jgi:molybdopterin synthase sulfur carrier subunit